MHRVQLSDHKLLFSKCLITVTTPYYILVQIVVTYWTM